MPLRGDDHRRKPDPRDAPKTNVSRNQARKPGAASSHEDDLEYIPDAKPQPRLPDPAPAKKDRATSKVGAKREGAGQDADGQGDGGTGEDDAASKPRRTEDRLTDPKQRRYAAGPTAGEVVAGQRAPRTGAKFAEVLPVSRTPVAPLPEPELRPPIFLSTFEGMRDIYLRTRGRASPKTREILESPELEDLVGMLTALHENEDLVRHPEAKHRRPLIDKLGGEPGPILLGLHDPRLREPWRLFLEGWDVWVADKTGPGVELFWEGEGEDEAQDQPMEILQVLRFKDGELTLEGRIGSVQDRITFDGQGFFRLKTDA